MQVKALAQRMGLENVRIIPSPDVEVPYVVGLFRPCIYIPALEMSDSALEMVLKHEMMHFYLRDAWIKTFYYVLLVLFWWNPIVHIFQGELDRVLELRCDFALVKDMNDADKITYLEAILLVVKGVNSKVKKPLLFSSSALSQTHLESFLVQRFDLIIALDHRKKHFQQIMTMGLVFILFVASFMVVVQPATFPSQEETNGAHRVNKENSYILINEKGVLELYIDNQFYSELSEPVPDLPIYNIETSIPVDNSHSQQKMKNIDFTAPNNNLFQIPEDYTYEEF
jgi:beta-lactamase regulating signal transducer with metallopeptidase domain